VFSFFRRRRKSLSRQAVLIAPSAAATTAADAVVAGSCPLAACASGARATVLAMGCGDAEACRLRALGLCEGASVSVVEKRHCMLLEVRGARLALGASITAGITVLPQPR
jgi:Fe2+ transport system protein FeoA